MTIRIHRQRGARHSQALQAEVSLVRVSHTILTEAATNVKPVAEMMEP
jgi:hypothetical protein